MGQTLRIGIDLGGTKIAAIALDGDGTTLTSERIATPQGDYPATIVAISDLIDGLERQLGRKGTVGVGIPGSLSPVSGFVRNANSTWLNGRPFDRDLAARLDRQVRMENDANCFALSEAHDGAAAGARSVFGVILGTGCGAGIVIDGKLLNGPLAVSGEWGHNPLPWPEDNEYPGPACWCGRHGCMETWVSGPALTDDHERRSGQRLSVEAIVASAERDDKAAKASLEIHAGRLARGLAGVVNLLDPEVIVLGGGLSSLAHLYETLPDLMAPHLFSDFKDVTIRPPRFGDASGVRGAAWLWGGSGGDAIAPPSGHSGSTAS